MSDIEQAWDLLEELELADPAIKVKVMLQGYILYKVLCRWWGEGIKIGKGDICIKDGIKSLRCHLI